MRNHWKLAGAALISLGLLAGCKTGGSSSTTNEPAKEEAVATKPSIPIPPDSPFAKVKVGMGRDEVFATIGNPTSISSYQTGKAWIPFHFSGSDVYRTVAHYKGIGTITFANDSAYTSGSSVISVDYDPAEPGFEKNE